MIDYAHSTVEEMMLFQAPTNKHLMDMAPRALRGVAEYHRGGGLPAAHAQWYAGTHHQGEKIRK